MPQIISNYRAFDIIIEGVLASEMISLELFDDNYTSLLSNKEFNTWFSHTDLKSFISQHVRLGELKLDMLRFCPSLIGAIGYGLSHLIHTPALNTPAYIADTCKRAQSVGASPIPTHLQWPHTHWIR